MHIDIDGTQAPTYWVHRILLGAQIEPDGSIARRLVCATLAQRYPEHPIADCLRYAPIAQHERSGDFKIRNTVYRVVVLPTPSIIRECAADLEAGLRPILLVPETRLAAADGLAELEGIARRVFLISIEVFVAFNIIHLAEVRQSDLLDILEYIIAQYNSFLAEAETDMSLQIEVH